MTSATVNAGNVQQFDSTEVQGSVGTGACNTIDSLFTIETLDGVNAGVGAECEHIITRAAAHFVKAGITFKAIRTLVVAFHHKHIIASTAGNAVIAGTANDYIGQD